MWESWEGASLQDKKIWSHVAKALWQIDQDLTKQTKKGKPLGSWEENKEIYMRQAALFLRRLGASGFKIS